MEFTFDDLKNAIEIAQQYINQINKNPTTQIGGNKWLNRMMTK